VVERGSIEGGPQQPLELPPPPPGSWRSCTAEVLCEMASFWTSFYVGSLEVNQPLWYGTIEKSSSYEVSSWDNQKLMALRRAVCDSGLSKN